MKKSDRAMMINSLTLSIMESLEDYESVKNPIAGFTIDSSNSKNSILERCKVARRELLVIMKEMEG